MTGPWIVNSGWVLDLEASIGSGLSGRRCCRRLHPLTNQQLVPDAQ